MPEETAVHCGLNSAIACFPDREALIRKLFLTDPTFQNICEDYRLALDGLERFEQIADDEARAELADYRALVRELEGELRQALDAATQDDGPCT